MKWYYLLLLLPVLLLPAACHDDELPTVDTSAVTPAPDFVDTRDGHTYRCVRIGNQIWMAENLAYFLPEGAAGGCITWGEKQTDFTKESLAVDTSTVVVVISDDAYAAIYTGIVNDPTHDWQKEIGVSKVMLGMYLSNFYAMYGQEGFTNMMAYYPAFYNLLLAQLDEARKAEREAYIAALKAEKARIPIDHRDAAERANGGYTAEHGYLYTLQGALAAVPAEGGWRLPSDADWLQLEAALGMPAAELGLMNAWRGEGFGNALKTGGAAGFNAVMSGCNAYQRTNVELFINQQECAYFWASDKGTMTQEEDASDTDNATDDNKVIVTYETGIVRQLAIYDTRIWRGTTRLDNKYRGVAYSVRLVKDAAQ